MPKRTLANARRAFDELTPTLNPEMYRRLDQELRKASAGAVTLATNYVNERVTDVLGTRQDVLNEWCSVRDAYAALAGEAQAGRLTAGEVNERLDAIRSQQRQMDRHVSEITRAAEVVERIEADPEAWADETFYGKYPHMTPEFSF